MEQEWSKNIFIILIILIILGGIGYFAYHQQKIIKEQKEEIETQRSEKEAAQAEAQKKQQEIEAEKERQRILNQDKDNDGLTLREEQNLGTSDNNPDTDGDSVPDKYDEHPVGGGRMVVKYLAWDYGGTWTWELNIPSDVINYYEQVPRPIWKGSHSYYSEFIDFNDKGIERLANGLKTSIDAHSEHYGWDYYDHVMYVVSLVQHLHYASDILVGFDDYTKYPMQTFNDGTGDCEDMAILTAAILDRLGYDVKLIFLNIPDGRKHLAVGVWGHDTYPGTYWIENNKKYFYIETTATGWDFGKFPMQWVGSTATLIDV